MDDALQLFAKFLQVSESAKTCEEGMPNNAIPVHYNVPEEQPIQIAFEASHEESFFGDNVNACMARCKIECVAPCHLFFVP